MRGLPIRPRGISLANLIERVRSRYDRFGWWIQPILRRFYPIEVVRRFTDRQKESLSALSAVLWLLTGVGVTWAGVTRSTLSVIIVAIASVAGVLTTLRAATLATATTRPVSPDFFRLIIRMRTRGRFQAVDLQSDTELREVANLEHEAFSSTSDTPLEERVVRIRRWLVKMAGLGQFIYFHEELIGYSVIIPVSEEQAEKFLKGYATEWAFDVNVPVQAPSKLTLYAQSVFVCHRHRGKDSSLGMAQAAVLNHLLELMKRVSKITLKDDSSGAVWNLLQRTVILADQGTILGGLFMSDLGFTRRERKTANKRNIWELDFSRPAAAGTALSLARGLISESLGVVDDLPPARPNLKDRLERTWIRYFGYTEK